MPKTTSGVDVGTGTGVESGINFSLLLKGAIALIVILAVGFIVTSSLSGNDAEGKDQKIPDKTDVDPASGGIAGAGGVAGVGIVTGKETDKPETDDDLKEYEVAKDLFVKGTVSENGIVTIYVENRANFQKPFPRLRVHLLVTIEGDSTSSIQFSVWEEGEHIHPGSTKTVKTDVFDLPEIKMAETSVPNIKERIKEIKINRISL